MRRRWFGLAGGAAVAVAAIAVVPALRGIRIADEVPVEVLRRESFVRRVVADGNLEAVHATPVIAPMEADGPLKIAWLVGDGVRVSDGDTVVRFDPTEMEKMLENGEADRDTAQSRIDAKRVETRGTLKNLERDASMAEEELQYAREFQNKDPEIFSRTEIIESNIDQQLARERLDHAESVHEIRSSLSEVDLDLLEIERRKAEIQIERADRGLRSLEVRAPHDGILVFKRSWRGIPKVGDTVWSGMPLAEIPKLDEMKANVFVLEADAGGLAVGQPASMVLESHPGESHAARVGKVAALAKPRVPWLPVQYFEVTLEIESTDPERMKPGQRVRAEITLEEIEDALTVPRSAVFDRDGAKVVYRRESARFEPVEVTLGSGALGRVVVLEGLEPGDEVALRDPTRSEAPAVPDQREGGGPVVAGNGS